MKKFTKRLLTGVVALGLLAPVATEGISVNPQNQVMAKSRWHRGAPAILKYNSSWISNPLRTSSSKRYRYTRWITPMGGKYGFNPTGFMFKNNHRSSGNGADSGALLAVNAHYRTIGYHLYQVRSGAQGEYVTATVKVHSRNRISIWSGKQYYGYFHRMSKHAVHYFEYHPYF